MGKSTISMVIFNSYVKLPEGTCMLVYSLSGLVQQAQRCATFIFVEFSEIY